MTDVSWTVNTNTDGDVTVDRVIGRMQTLTRGQTITLRVRFDASSAYTTIREYLDFAHAVATTVGLDGTPFYRELHTDSEELLLSFDPDGTDMPSEVTGFWAILVGGTDRTNGPVSVFELELELFVLAELSEHADRSAAETAHEV